MLTVGRKGDFISLKRVEHERRRQRVEVSHGGQIYEIDLPLAGEFQVSNALVSGGTRHCDRRERGDGVRRSGAS